MNYQKLYNAITGRANNRLLDENIYVEKHHIIPQSMGGTNISENIVRLTAKEHFVAHHLLWKIYRNPQMTKAFMLMCNTKRNGIKYKISAREYSILKEDNRKFRSEFMTGRTGNNLGKTLPQEWRDNISKSLTGHRRCNGGSIGFKGKHHTEENKKAISERRKGVGTHFTPHSEETKQMMRENRKGKTKIPWTEERKAARRKLLAEKFSQQKTPD
jgi:hypothetical protein